MHTLATATFLITLTGVLAGCAGDAASTAPSDADLVRAAPSQPTPLTGRCETSFAPPPYPLPPVLRQVDEGTCQLSHLGRAAMYLVQDIHFATGTQVSVEFTFTAPNGDVLRATNVGTSAPSGSGVQFQGTTTFVGGTGRFANATGEARLEGTANCLTNTATLSVVDGWIAYDASAGAEKP